MSEESKDQINTFGAGLLGFVVVVVLGGFLILHQGGGVKAPVATYAPVDAAPSSEPAPYSIGKAVRPAAAVAESSPAPLLPAGSFDATSPAAGSAPAAASTSAPVRSSGAKLVVSQHLDGGSSGSSSASASAASARESKKNLAAKNKSFLPQKLDVSKNQGTLVSTVHYGVSSRAELMGRAAGPVYNFSGKSAGAPGSPAATAGSDASASSPAADGVETAQKQVDASSLDDDSKATLKQELNQARQTIQPSGGQ